MNLKEARKLYKDAISRKFTVEECVSIMAPLGVPSCVIASIASLVCDQPERLNPEARKGFDSLNFAEMQREESEEVLPLTEM